MRQPTSTAATPATASQQHPPRNEWLVAALMGLIPDEHAAALGRITDEHPWTAAVNRGWVTDDAVLAMLSARFRMRIANVLQVAPQALQAVTETLARRYRILPLAVSDSAIDIATADPFDLDCERTLAFVLGRNVRMYLASPAQIERRLDELYRPARIIEQLLDDGFAGVAELEPVRDETPDDTDVAPGADDRPIIRLVDRIVAKAIQQRSSDIHLEPEENGVTVRYRIDGVLKNDSLIPRSLALPLVARVKIMARLDIADRLRPQDGRARVAISGAPVDLCISTLPAALGEKVVIRILDSRQTVLALDALGLRAADAARIEGLLRAREGLLCVTGPTGSGKTTTLYSIVRHIQRRGVNIVTVEDPVEYRLQGIVQVQVNEKTGLTFPAALRSILRQDPDVILIGEIRDRETAQIAVQAALTGHLVLTTLHTIDAASAVVRLADVGIAGYKTAAALKGVVAQRLMRRLCVRCRQAQTGSLPAAIRDRIASASTYRAAGCDECSQTGYRGRLSIAEILVVDAEVERRITSGDSTERIYEAARRNGMQSLWESAVAHVRDGVTSVEELLRVIEVPAHAESPSLADVVAAASSPPAPPLANRVFEGAAFDLVDEYAVAARRQRVALIIGGGPSHQHVRSLFAAHDFTVHESELAKAPELVDSRTPDVVLVGAAADSAPILARLRAHPAMRRVPVVVIASRSADEEAEVRAFEAGANEYFSLPLRPRVFIARVSALIESRTR